MAYLGPVYNDRERLIGRNGTVLSLKCCPKKTPYFDVCQQLLNLGCFFVTQPLRRPLLGKLSLL